MLMKRIINFILGNLEIRVEGFFIERFINSCVLKNILLIGSKIEKNTVLTANISIKDFYKIKDIARKTKSKVKIINKKGLPFLFERYKKRKLFALLLAIVIVRNNHYVTFYMEYRNKM